MAAPADTLQSRYQNAFAHCAALLRSADKDRILAALFAPTAQRSALHALYAFNVEISRVREAIREPLAGEIRLQWWSDAIAGAGAGEVGSNPVAAALLAVMERHSLSVGTLSAMIAAHLFDLYNEPMATVADFDDHGRATSAALLALSAQILGAGGGPGLGELTFHAGLAHATAGLLQALPVHAARGQLYLPVEALDRHGARREDIAAARATPELLAAMAEMRRKARAHLAEARRLAAHMPAELLPALLPTSLVRPILDRMDRADYDPFRPPCLAQWRRQWRLWRTAKRPAQIFT